MNSFSWYIKNKKRTILGKYNIVLYLIGALALIKLKMHPIFLGGTIASFFLFIELRKNIGINLSNHIEYMLSFPISIEKIIKMEYDATFFYEYKKWVIIGIIYFVVYSVDNSSSFFALILDIFMCILVIPIVYEAGAIYSYVMYKRVKELPVTICSYMVISIYCSTVVLDTKFVFLAIPIYIVISFFRRRIRVNYILEYSKGE